MARVLEDITVGSTKSPSRDNGDYRWEDANRRVRNVLAGETVADSIHVKLLIEAGRLPVFYFPVADVRQDLLVASDQQTESSLKGTASYWHIRVGDRLAENAVWRYPNPPAHSPAVQDYYAFYWHKLDHWYEENDEVFAHARDPRKRSGRVAQLAARAGGSWRRAGCRYAAANLAPGDRHSDPVLHSV